MSEKPEQHKSWLTIGEYTSYDLARLKKEEVSEQFDLIKIKRGSRTKDQKKKEVYRVKGWSKPLEKTENKKKKGSKVKKGINNKRKEKHDNKKIRLGLEE